MSNSSDDTEDVLEHTGKLFERWLPNIKITSPLEVSLMNLQTGTSVGSCLAFSSWNKKSISRMKVKKNIMKCLCGERRKLPVSSFPTRLAQGSYCHFHKVAWDRLHAGICEWLLSQPEGLWVTRVTVQAVTLFVNPALHHDPLVLLLQCTDTDVVINSGELHCLPEKNNSLISLSTSTKALGHLFYGYGSGKLNTIFFWFCFLALGD